MGHSQSTILGLVHRRYGDPTPFGISLPDRLLHLYIIGQTGTGKSTLLQNMVWQDARNQQGVCLIDPHGDLADALHTDLSCDHVYWDVADPSCPYGYNPLARTSEAHRPLVVECH